MSIMMGISLGVHNLHNYTRRSHQSRYTENNSVETGAIIEMALDWVRYKDKMITGLGPE